MERNYIWGYRKIYFLWKFTGKILHIFFQIRNLYGNVQEKRKKNNIYKLSYLEINMKNSAPPDIHLHQISAVFISYRKNPFNMATQFGQLYLI